jgi:5-oxoprolinase (ATP-hydrolysing) subunit A
MPRITAANIACGFHGSDFNHVRPTVQLAKQHKVEVGAHPSLPDLRASAGGTLRWDATNRRLA